jgi:hypothetical protein
VILCADHVQSAMEDPVLRLLCPYCIEKAWRIWPFYRAYRDAVEAGFSPTGAWRECSMCNFGHGRVLTDFLVELGCSVTSNVSANIIRGFETRVGFLITLPDEMEVVLELDADERFMPPGWGSGPYRIAASKEVLKMLYFRSIGKKFIRLHQTFMMGEWRSHLRRALFENPQMVQFVGDMPDNRWLSIQLEVASWNEFRVKDWIRANRYRLQREY